MRRVRAINNKTGEESVLNAKDLESSQRYDFKLCCLDEGCPKTYHWRKGYKNKENTAEVAPTFVENHKSEDHNPDCRWDFVKIASKRKDITFYENGYYHLRVNFPLGGSVSDMFPRTGRLTKEQHRVAENNTHLKGLSSMEEVVKFLEKEFGSIEAEELENLKLHYQGPDYIWSDVYAASDDYGAMVDVPSDPGTGNIDARLSVVRVSHETKENDKGKRRFVCEWQQGVVRDKVDKIRPTIVCANEEVAQAFEGLSQHGGVALVSARPFVPPNFFEKKKWERDAVPVSLYVTQTDQITELDAHEYWRYQPHRQLDLDIELDQSLDYEGPV